MLRAACYIRVSTDDQIEFSPDSQLREIRSFSMKNNMILLDEFIFIDEGISGREAAKRHGFQRMIAVAKQTPKPFDVLLLYKFSRFARNREDSVVYKSLLRNRCGIDVVSVTEPLDSDNKMSGIMEAIIESMDEFYSQNLSEDVKRTMTEKAMRGGLQSTPAYGYTVKDNVLTIIPEEAEIIREIYNRFLAGDGYMQIAHSLNLRGIRTKRGNLFENRTVEYIIRNPVYKGYLRWTPSGRIRRKYDRGDTIIQRGKHDPIIDNSTWEKAQDRVSEIKAQYSRYYKPPTPKSHWLSSLMHCSECGGTLCRSGEYFVCNHYVHGSCKYRQGIKYNAAEELILNRLLEDMSGSKELSISHIPRIGAPNTSSLIEMQLKKMPAKLERLKDAYMAGIDTLEEYKASKAILLQEEEHLREELAKFNSVQANQQQQAEIRKKIAAAYKVISDPSVSMADKYSVSHNVIFRIDVNKIKQEISIIYSL